MENTKRDLSLDFTKPRHPRGGVQPVPSLVTPILNLSTPEFNKLMPGGELPVLTPNGISSVISQPNVLPSPLIPTTVNRNNIINHVGSQNTNNCVSNYNSKTNNNLQNSNKCNGNQNQSQKKRSHKNREIDVEKIEKKRERNRLAAKKCRQRKIETIDELKKTVSERDMEIDALRKAVSERDVKYQKLEMAFEEYKNMKSKEHEAIVREMTELKNLIARRS